MGAFLFLECPVCEFSAVVAAGNGRAKCPLCAEDNGVDIGMRSRPAAEADVPEGIDERDAPPVVFGPIDGPVPVESAPTNWAEDRRIAIWTVYRRPKDQPDLFVARRHVIGESGEPIPTNLIVTHRQIEPIRRRLRRLSLTCLGRHPGDGEQIVESWI